MKYSIFDENGTLVSRYDSKVVGTPPSTPGTGTGGGNSGGTTSVNKAPLEMGTFWTDTAYMVTDWRQMDKPIVQYDTSHSATMKHDFTVGAAGYVASLSARINGSTNGYNVYFQLYINDQPSGLVTKGSSTNDRVNAQIDGGTKYAFKAGDTLSVYLKGDDTNINQSFSSGIEITYTS